MLFLCSYVMVSTLITSVITFKRKCSVGLNALVLSVGGASCESEKQHPCENEKNTFSYNAWHMLYLFSYMSHKLLFACLILFITATSSV